MDGYETKTISVECKLNGWYFGNILIGGLIGLLIVDPATGAMYKLSSEGITEDLMPLKSSSGSPSLKIIDKATISADLEKYLVRVK
jgi:hypothetical protein